jgi:hypothetical protein
MAQARETFSNHLAYGGETAARARNQVVRGEWLFYWSPVIDQMKRQGRLTEALELAIECADCAERTLDSGPVWGWVRKVAIIARKMRRYDFEVDVLQDFLARAWHPERQDDARHRLAKACALAAKLA